MAMLNTSVRTQVAPLQPLLEKEEIFYPSSDGKPMAENSKQWDLIVLIAANLIKFIRHDFVGSDLLWYPVEGRPDISVAPDVLVTFGRPVRDRLSYKQWEENNQPPQVVFEIWSPSNTPKHRREKLEFYERHGVQEYYAFDPDTGLLEGWLNNELGLEPIQTMQNWVSPLLGTRFATVNNELVMHAPDGSRFLPLRQIYDQLDIAQEATADARARTEAEREKAEAERRAKESALAQAEAERAAKELAFAKLRALGIDPNTL